MSFTTYDGLKTNITNWLGGRTDLTSFYDDWIVLFESFASRKLHLRLSETTATLTPSSGSVALPADYIGWRRVTWTGSTRVDLEYVHPSILQAYYPTTPTGTPQTFTVEGSTLKVRPTDDTGLEFVYYAKNTAATDTLNWLFTNYPDAYLFGALTEGGGFTGDSANTSIWKARRDEVMEEIKLVDFRNTGGMAVRAMGYTP